MKLAMILLAAIPVFADPIIVGAIGLTGSGRYMWNFGGGPSLKFTASGSNGVDSVSVSFDDESDIGGGFPIPPPATLTPFGTCYGVGASIDAVSGSFKCIAAGNTFTFSLGGGVGDFLDIFDPSHNLIAHATLDEQIVYTSYSEFYLGSRLINITADFAIIQVPEARTASMLIGACLLAIAWRRRLSVAAR